MSPPEERRELARRSFVRAGWIAWHVVDVLRRTTFERQKVTGGEAVLALLFAAARVSRLRHGSRENFLSVAGILWDVALDDVEATPTASGSGSQAPPAA